MSSVNEEETDTEESGLSRAASRKASSSNYNAYPQRMSVSSVGSPNGGSSRSESQPCTIRHMKIKERSCSERSDSGFSESANQLNNTNNLATNTCETKLNGDKMPENNPKNVKENGKLVKMVNILNETKEDSKSIAIDQPVNPNLLKTKLERIVSLQLEDEIEDRIVENTKSNDDNNDLQISSQKESKEVNTLNEALDRKVHIERSKSGNITKEVVNGGSKLGLVIDPISSELNYDIKRYHLDGNSVRLRKQSLENHVKKDLAVAPAPAATSSSAPTIKAASATTIKVPNRVSDLKSKFDMGIVSTTAAVAVKQSSSIADKPASRVAKLKINLDFGSSDKGNSRTMFAYLVMVNCCCGFLL